MSHEATTTRKRPGRKTEPGGKLVAVGTRVSEAERAALTQAAEAAGVSPSVLVRSVLREWLATRATTGATAPQRSEVQGERATAGHLSPPG